VQRLGPQDASFLYLETPAVHQHVGGLAILDPSTRPNKVLRFEDLVEVITSRVDLTPRFRQKIVFPPFSSARPVWADDQNFDPYFHMRRAALPSPGGRRELVDYVQRVISRPLDRTKPLWELYLIEGMEDGLVAILTKVHHAMVDGMAAIDLASAVYDFSPEPQILTPKEWTPEPEPGRFELLRDALRDRPGAAFDHVLLGATFDGEQVADASVGLHEEQQVQDRHVVQVAGEQAAYRHLEQIAPDGGSDAGTLEVPGH